MRPSIVLIACLLACACGCSVGRSTGRTIAYTQLPAQPLPPTARIYSLVVEAPDPNHRCSAIGLPGLALGRGEAADLVISIASRGPRVMEERVVDEKTLAVDLQLSVQVGIYDTRSRTYLWQVPFQDQATHQVPRTDYRRQRFLDDAWERMVRRIATHIADQHVAQPRQERVELAWVGDRPELARAKDLPWEEAIPVWQAILADASLDAEGGPFYDQRHKGMAAYDLAVAYLALERLPEAERAIADALRLHDSGTYRAMSARIAERLRRWTANQR